jgi:hypothetical protein
MYGGSLFLGYSLIFETLRHHDHTNKRPMFIDHQIAMTIIGGVASVGMAGGSPQSMVVGAIFSFFTLGPMLWWLKLNGMSAGQMNKPANVFYTDDCTKEEIERFTHQDQVDQITFSM